MQANIIYTVLEQVWSSHETEYAIVNTESPLLAVLCTAAPPSRKQLTLRSARVISDWLSDFLLILIFLPRRQLLHPWRWSVVSVPCRLSWIAFTVSSWLDFSYETGAVSVALRRFVKNFQKVGQHNILIYIQTHCTNAYALASKFFALLLSGKS